MINTNYNVEFIFGFRFENSITTINPRSQYLGKERKMFGETTYLKTKSFKTVYKSMQRINMIKIYY